jgi:hypothetical protein
VGVLLHAAQRLYRSSASGAPHATASARRSSGAAAGC